MKGLERDGKMNAGVEISTTETRREKEWRCTKTVCSYEGYGRFTPTGYKVAHFTCDRSLVGNVSS